MKKFVPFVPFNAESSAVGKPFHVRSKGQPEVEVLWNQHGQLVTAERGHLLPFVPEEQCAPTEAATVAKGSTAPSAD